MAAHSDVQQNLLKGPFYWREKKEVFSRMQKDRFIPVSVTSQDDVWHFKGAGLVQAPKDFMFAEIQKYEKLKELPDHFQNVHWDAETKILSMDVLFMSRTRKLKLRLEPEDGENLYFRIEEGWFEGLEGVMMVRDVSDAKNFSEIGIMAVRSVSPSWVPRLVFSLAAEGVMHHVAQSLRSMAESDYKNNKAGSDLSKSKPGA